MKSLLESFIFTTFILTFAHASYDLTRFLVVPKDKIFYYNSRMVLNSLCSPLNASSEITWLKDGRRLRYNDRIQNVKSNYEKHWYIDNLDSESVIFELIINPLLEEDVGIYTCRSRNTYEEASVDFIVNITDDCPNDSFKCLDSRTCLLVSAVCDGDAHCNDKRDESMEAGCELPHSPNLQLLKRGKTTLKFSWQPVAKVHLYQLNIYNNTINKTIDIKNNHPGFTINNLQPGTEYYVRIRSISHTGVSKYSPAIEVSTIIEGPPPIPQRPRSAYQTKDSIAFSWDNVKDASSYEVEIQHPSGERRKSITYPSRPDFLFEGLVDNTTYALRVRAKSIDGYSNFSKKLYVNTLPLGKPSQPLNLEASVKEQDVTITWEYPNELGNHHLFDLTYQVKYCPLNKVKIQSNDTEIIRKGKCLTTEKISDTKARLSRLKPFTLYTYSVTTYGLRNLQGGFASGNFTTAMYTTGQPTTEYNPFSTGNEQFSGIVIFGIVTGSLIVLLVLAFFFAYLCKWKLLMDAMEEYNLTQGKKSESKGNLSQKSDVLLENYEKY